MLIIQQIAYNHQLYAYCENHCNTINYFSTNNDSDYTDSETFIEEQESLLVTMNNRESTSIAGPSNTAKSSNRRSRNEEGVRSIK